MALFRNGGIVAISALVYAALAGHCASAQSHTGAGNPVDQLPRNQLPETRPVTVELPPTPAASHVAQEKIIPVRFAVEGVHSVPFATVQAVFTPLVGHEITVNQVTAAATSVTALYKAAGFAMSFAFIPEQDFKGGVVRVVVVEGYIDRVELSGDPGGSAASIDRLTGPVLGERPLKTDTFTRLVGLLARLPGIVVTAKVNAPKSTDGATQLVLAIKRKPITLATALDTYHPGVRLLATATANGLTPLGDQFTVSHLFSHGVGGEKYDALGEAIPLGSDGLIVRLDAYHYSANATVALPANQTLSDAQADGRVSVSASYPILLEAKRQIVLNGGFDAARDDDRYSTAFGGLDQRTNLRIFRFGSSIGLAEDIQHIGATADLYQGVPGLGASVSPTSNTAATRFTRLVIGATDKIDLPEQYEVTGAYREQFCGQRLATSEQIGFGGAQFGAGYPSSDIAGDSGWGASMEVGRTLTVSNEYIHSLLPYLALDTAQTHSNTSHFTAARIASVSLGTRVSDGHHYTVDVSLAKPIAAAPIDATNRPLRLNFNFSYRTD